MASTPGAALRSPPLSNPRKDTESPVSVRLGKHSHPDLEWHRSDFETERYQEQDIPNSAPLRSVAGLAITSVIRCRFV